MDTPWCPAGCTRDFGVSDELLKLVYRSMRNHEGKSFRCTVNCPKCGRPIDVEGEMEWDFDCSKGDGWEPKP